MTGLYAAQCDALARLADLLPDRAAIATVQSPEFLPGVVSQHDHGVDLGECRVLRTAVEPVAS
eukprot:m.1013392 g.1013392  ORF g.1013392 m.1013392 type:complete len:63 (+) comp24067_c0_seq54:3011-3199(+)